MNFTPTQELILDCLAARDRLGEQLWTFDARNAKALESLAKSGHIVLMRGVVEHTYRAYLTDRGREYATSTTYLSPLEKRLVELQDRIGALHREHVALLSEALPPLSAEIAPAPTIGRRWQR